MLQVTAHLTKSLKQIIRGKKKKKNIAFVLEGIKYQIHSVTVQVMEITFKCI